MLITNKTIHNMYKTIIIVLFLLSTFISNSQTKWTLVFDQGISGKLGDVPGGIPVTLSDDFMLHVYGEREIISIVEFENFSKFKEAEQQTYEINKKKYFQRICGNDSGCGDTDEISYEVVSSGMFNYCRVIYFTFKSSIVSSSINGWYYLEDGKHTILIIENEDVVFQKEIQLKNGLLVN